MAKHKADKNFESLRGKPAAYDGNRMGLTEAFSPVDDASSTSVSGDAVRSGAHADLESASAPHAAPAAYDGPGEYQHKARRMRKVLVAVAALLVVLLLALGYLTYRLAGESATLATQQTQERSGSQEADSFDQADTNDATSTVSKETDVAPLASLLGMTRDEAVAAVGHGAQTTSEESVDEEGSDVKSRVELTLADEPADARSGTPKVYLSLDEEGRVVRSGYSAATASLGYGALSFADAVSSEHIVEKALREAGLSVDDGAAVLPADKAEYSTYASDGATLLKEACDFEGTGSAGGAEHSWEAVLLYDYVAANSSGNLNDTVRVLYLYIDA